MPDALDLIARSLKAGHAFMIGVKMVAEEFQEPASVEFQKVYDEINFGLSVMDALFNLCERVDLPDLRFFAISVVLQRETGGNLAEIIEKIAQLTRERIKFRGRVQTLAAEGKLSAIVILGLVPFSALFTLPGQPGLHAHSGEPSNREIHWFDHCLYDAAGRHYDQKND